MFATLSEEDELSGPPPNPTASPLTGAASRDTSPLGAAQPGPLQETFAQNEMDESIQTKFPMNRISHLPGNGRCSRATKLRNRRFETG
jgi:hypothetical protein